MNADGKVAVVLRITRETDYRVWIDAGDGSRSVEDTESAAIEAYMAALDESDDVEEVDGVTLDMSLVPAEDES